MRRAAILAAAMFPRASLPGRGESGPTLVPVSGKWTLDGTPLDGASMTFPPEPGNKESSPGSCVRDADGGYRPKFNDRDGLAVGRYPVLVTKLMPKPGRRSPR
jgi:hypothetical protein